MQAAATAPQLAFQLRAFDAHLQWEGLKRPTSESDPFSAAELLERRPGVDGLGWEYLLQLTPPERVSPTLLCFRMPMPLAGAEGGQKELVCCGLFLLRNCTLSRCNLWLTMPGDGFWCRRRLQPQS